MYDSIRFRVFEVYRDDWSSSPAWDGSVAWDDVLFMARLTGVPLVELMQQIEPIA